MCKYDEVAITRISAEVRQVGFTAESMHAEIPTCMRVARIREVLHYLLVQHFADTHGSDVQDYNGCLLLDIWGYYKVVDISPEGVFRWRQPQQKETSGKQTVLCCPEVSLLTLEHSRRRRQEVLFLANGNLHQVDYNSWITKESRAFANLTEARNKLAILREDLHDITLAIDEVRFPDTCLLGMQDAILMRIKGIYASWPELMPDPDTYC